ncbi:GerAB/ArcD/ProY family transporter [Thalassobacillus hwangdonensis]|uniref:Endospore germination permease n=1 Tax=Thalassobacillus hwangdonensis TaxID=546108 RepID=A0ABW3L377_9BACI
MSDLNQLTRLQLVVILISTMIGVGIILMPRELAIQVNSPDLWMSIIYGAVAVSIISTLYVSLSQRYPGCSLYEMAPAIMGKFIGSVINLYYVFYCLVVAAYILRITAGIINNYLLDTTPLPVIIGCFLIVSLYLISNGAGDVVRFFQLYFPIMLFMFVVLCLLSIKDVDIQNVRPVFSNELLSSIGGVTITFFSFLGLEFLLFFASLVKKKPAKKLLVTLWISIWLTTAIYVTFHIISIGVLGVEELKEITFPTIEMAKSIEFKGFFFERFELIFLFGWLTTAFTSFTAYAFAMTLGFHKLFSRSKLMLIPAGAAIFLLSLFPKGLTEVFHYSSYVSIISIIATVALPLLLLVVSLIRGKNYAS